MYAIQAQKVTKRYRNGAQALENFSVQVREGEIFTLLGPNGAGKSTLIRILTTYLKPDSGEVRMLGKELCRDAASIRQDIACVAQQTSIDTYLSLEENMLFQSRLYRIPKAEAKHRMEKLICDFDLHSFRKYPVASYSGGIRRRLDIALNLMSNPMILFLDEPTVGMDIQSRMAMWDMVRKIRDDFGTTIFLTTHYLEEADNLSNTVCIMKEGREVAQGTLAELRSYIRQDTLLIHFSTDAEAKKHRKDMKPAFPESQVTIRNGDIVVNTKEGHLDMERALGILLKHNIPFRGIEISQPTLEDVLLRLKDKWKAGEQK